jgi:heat shock protein HtpX
MNKDFSQIINKIAGSCKLETKSGFFKTFKWLVLANAAVVLSLTIISGGALIAYSPFILLLGSVFPFISLLFSKSLAKKAHNIRIIDPETNDGYEKSLYEMVKSLCQKAGIEKIPEVGIYESSDMNAFATGPSKNQSLITFSSALLNNMDEKGIAAVAAHEIAHIVNGDMITMSIVQSVVNAFTLLITIPLSFIKIFALFSDQVDALAYLFISFVKFIITSIVLFLGNLVVMAFSRKREFEADKLAAYLLDKNYMIHALKILSQDTVTFPKEQKAYAAFKINAPSALFDIFSTHPSIERRIERLEKLEL